MLGTQTTEEASEQVGKRFKGKHVLIAGGFGFVGSHLARTLLGFGASVSVLDLRTDPDVASLLNDEAVQLRSRVHVIQGDVGNAQVVLEVMSHIHYDFVFNFAGHRASPEDSAEPPYDSILASTVGLVNILDAQRALKSRRTMVFHTLTDRLADELDEKPCTDDRTQVCRIGVYDGAKLAPDVVFARTYYQAFGIPTVVLRVCNLFGPCDYNMDCRLIPRTMHSLYGSRHPGRPELDFDLIDDWHEYLYIDDCIHAILLLTLNPTAAGQVYNLSAAKFVSTPAILKKIVHMAYEIEKEFDRDRAELILKNGISVRVRAGNCGNRKPREQRGSEDHDRRVTEFLPSVEFTDALNRTIRAYRSHFVAKGTL